LVIIAVGVGVGVYTASIRYLFKIKIIDELRLLVGK